MLHKILGALAQNNFQKAATELWMHLAFNKTETFPGFIQQGKLP